ncbi:hypothetical protein pdam_00019060 [Pocillopora damicornis]|uniref:Uncharacterized protein n=1 Tax=Pocillopora damicornis TaxID=46731 RepID=A0A3M6UET5_POCDA|nr:hypothetical protein pdam_00019060 [Pocillopora damicornis]
MEKKMAAGWSLQYEVGRHIKVQRSSFRLNVVLLIIMIMKAAGYLQIPRSFKQRNMDFDATLEEKPN